MSRTLDTATIGPDTPLRLAEAVAIAFPTGAMTVSGLRKERDRGRLIVEKIAGKEFTTLRNIEAMRRACQGQPRDPGSISTDTKTAALRSTSSEMGTTAKARAAAEMIVMELRARLKPTSARSTGPAAPVIPLKSR